MNYYKRHLGDYAKDTRHLSLAEHGAFCLLLDYYYSTEKPIPDDRCERIANAYETHERNAVRSVLEAFFTLTPDGWRNQRADEEIEAFRAKSLKAKASAEIKWAKRNANADANASKTQCERNASHKPLAISQIEEDGEAGASLPPEGGEPAADDENGEQPKQGRPPCPHERIIAAYHEILPELRQVREWNETRRRLLARRWSESPERQTVDWWRKYFGYVRKSDFLMGKTTGRDGRAFDCDLEWLVRPQNFAKVIEGKYE